MRIAFGTQNSRNLHFPCHFHVLFDEMKAHDRLRMDMNERSVKTNQNNGLKHEINEHQSTKEVSKTLKIMKIARESINERSVKTSKS